MADKSLRVRLSATISQFRGEMGSASQAVQAFGRDIDKVSKQHEKLGKVAGTAALAIGVGVAAALVKAGTAAAQFEERMRNVNSISGLSEGQFTQLGKSVLDLSRKLPQSANTLAEGLYDIASSGFQGADGLKVLQASAEAATAGVSNTATAAKAITAVLNAYGKTAGDAGDVSDVLFQTVNLGVVSFGELAGVIGDVVGLGAQAGIGIDQLGSAIATMTLSGISGAESGTSLNRTIQSLIQPSDALALVFKNLGYESGANALQTKGLHAVMEDLRKATGGNVTAMLQLFPNIRAARGAMALMSNEGQNYNRVAAEIEDRNKRQGATHRALAEQMKSTAAQARLFMNDLNAAAITVGTKLLPTVREGMADLQRFGREGVQFVGDQLRRLAPFFDGVVSSGRNLATIAGNLLAAFGPLGKAIAVLVGGAVIASLNTLAGVLGSITGFLARHTGLVEALAVLYGVKLAGSVIIAARAFAAAKFEAIAGVMMSAAGGVDALATSIKAMGIAGAATEAVVTLGLSAVVISLVQSLQAGDKAAKQFSTQIVEGLNVKTLGGIEKALGRIRDRHNELGKELDKKLDRPPWEALFSNDETKIRAQLDKGDELAKQFVQIRDNITRNLDDVSKSTGFSRDTLARYADQVGVDLTGGFEASTEARQKLVDDLNKVAGAAGYQGAQVASAANLDIDRLQAMATAADEMAKKVDEAFKGATDVLANWDPSKSDLPTFFKTTIHDAETFANQIQAVAQRGLNPDIIADLLKAGPQKALPILAQLVQDHSGRLIKAYNDTEKTLGDINARVLAMARITNQAVMAPTDALVRDIGSAMSIATAAMGQANANISGVAGATHLTVDEVKRVAREFGITIAGMATDASGIGPAVQAGVSPAVTALATLQQYLQITAGMFRGLAQAPLTPGAPQGPAIGGPLGPTPSTAPSKARAMGGVDPHVTTSETVLYGERQTGGEAFIPRIGDRGRALATLATAASWYGADLIPMAGGGILGDEWKAWKKWSGPALGWKGAHALGGLGGQFGDRAARGFNRLIHGLPRSAADYHDRGSVYHPGGLMGDPAGVLSNKGSRLNTGGGWGDPGYFPRSGRSFATGGILYPSSAPMGSSGGYGVDIAGRIEAAIGRALAVARPIEINAPQQADPLHVASAVEWALRY